MSAQHTPGPWHAGKPAWYRGQRSPDDGKIPVTAGEQGIIANVYGPANARLIAAAPDILAALKVLREDVRAYEAWQRPCYALDLADAAIAKAEGRS